MTGGNGVGVEPVKYQFGPRFQRDVLTLAVRDPAFLTQVRDAIDPRYFERDEDAILARLLLRHFDRFRERPTRDRLLAKIERHAERFKLDDDLRGTLQKNAKRLYDRDLPTDATWVREHVGEFGRIQATKAAILDVVQHLGEPVEGEAEGDRFDAIIPKIQRALAVGTGRSLGLQVFDDPAHHIRHRSPTDNPTLRIRTGFKTLDHVMRGGAGAGRLCLVMGESGIGKSSFLVNVACAPARAGKRVVYISTEMPEYDVLIRCLSRLTKTEIPEVEEQSPTFQEAAEQLAGLGGIDRYLRIVRVYPDSPVTTVRSVLSRVEAHDGVRPDLIVVDYADELRPPRRETRSTEDSSYAAFGAVYSELISVAMDWSCPVWTAAQVRREFYDHEAPGLAAVGESLKKAQMAHLVCSLSQTEVEEKKHRLRLFVAKHRAGRAKFSIPLRADLKRCLLREIHPEKKREQDDARTERARA
jgi:hypothetical protein